MYVCVCSVGMTIFFLYFFSSGPSSLPHSLCITPSLFFSSFLFLLCSAHDLTFALFSLSPHTTECMTTRQVALYSVCEPMYVYMCVCVFVCVCEELSH